MCSALTRIEADLTQRINTETDTDHQDTELEVCVPCHPDKNALDASFLSDGNFTYKQEHHIGYNKANYDNNK